MPPEVKQVEPVEREEMLEQQPSPAHDQTCRQWFLAILDELFTLFRRHLPRQTFPGHVRSCLLNFQFCAIGFQTSYNLDSKRSPHNAFGVHRVIHYQLSKIGSCCYGLRAKRKVKLAVTD